MPIPFRSSVANSSTARLAAAALLVLLLPACAGLRPGYETPSVTVNSFRALPSDGGMPNFEIGLRVVNPNREALKLAGIAYSIRLDGHEIIKGVGNDLPVIEAYGSGDVTVTASANLFAGIRLVSELMRVPKDSFDYEFEAKLDPGGLYPTIRVTDSGTIAAANLAR
jgi:Late embryogenesis abundant protein